MTVKIEGMKFHQEILERFRLHAEACDPELRPKASAYAAYLCLLNQCAKEFSAKGIVSEFSLVLYSEKTGVPYGSLYDGMKYLEKQRFVEEKIHNGRSVWVLCDVERLNSPEVQQLKNDEKVSMNYFIIPRVVFETTILKELVRTSNSSAFELLFSLLNQFRVSLASNKVSDPEKVKQTYNMKTLKTILKKNAKGVRNVLDILSPLFDVDFRGVSARGKQIWIRQVQFNLRSECIKDDVDEYQVDPLVAKYNQDMVYFLDNNGIKYRPSTDLKDIMLSFKQEVIKPIQSAQDDNRTYNLRDQWIRDVYTSATSHIQEKILNMKKYYGKVAIYCLGGYFRRAFRLAAKKHFNNAPVKYFDVKLEFHKSKLQLPLEGNKISLDDLPF